MIFNLGKLESASMILDKNNRLISIVANGLSGSIDTYLGKELHELFRGSELKAIEILIKNYKLLNIDMQDKIVVKRNSNLYEYKIELKYYSNNLQISLYRRNIVSITKNTRLQENNLFYDIKYVDLALQSLSEGIIITDKNGIIQSINKHALKILEIDQIELGKHKLSNFITCSTKDTNMTILDPITKIITNNTPINWGLPFKINLTNNNSKIVDCCANYILDDGVELCGVIMLFWDMTKQVEKEEKLEYLSKYDEMTGLYNRNYLEMNFSGYDNEENYPLAVIMGDLNGLKLTNDTYGHGEGDELLKESGQIIRSVIHNIGIAGRWGGDEFLIFLPKTKYKEVNNICKKIKDEFNNSKTCLNRHSISLGYASKNNIDTHVSDVIKEAEDNMYKNKLMESKSFRNSVINSIQQTLHEKSIETEEHGIRLCKLSKLIGEKIKLSSKELNDLKLLAMLHDIGKITINNDILEKKEKLTEYEWDIMRSHSESGFRILKAIPELSHIAEYVLSHHERWDGDGYPRGLKGEDIPLLSRIISVVDSYDAMTNDRIYRKAIAKRMAIKEIIDGSNKQFDPVVVDVFVSLINEINNS